MLEKMAHYSHKNGHLFLSNVIFVVSKEPISVPEMTTALTMAGKRHPLLRSRVLEDLDGSLYYEEMKHFHPNFSIDSTSDWKEVYERQLVNLYDSDAGPLWRVTYLPNVTPAYTTDDYQYEYTLVFGFRHDILDGTSYVKIFNQFLNDLEDIHDGGSDEVQSLPMPPPVDSLVRKPSILECVLHVIAEHLLLFTVFKKLLVRQMMKMPSNLWIDRFGAEVERDSSVPVKTSLVPLTFTEDESNGLLKMCKKNAVTMHSAILVAAHIAISEIYHNGVIPEDFTVNAGTTVNLRGVFKDKFKDYAAHVVPYFIAIVVPTRITSEWRTDFWTLAQTVSSQIHDDLSSQCLKMVKMVRVLGKCIAAGITPSMFRKKHHERFDTFFAFTNLGNCNALSDRKGILKCVARFGSSGEHKYGHIFANNLMTVNNRLHWTVSYYPNITSKEVTQKYANRVKNVLQTILKN